MKSRFNARRFSVEILEERTLLAVTAGGMEMAAEHVSPTQGALWIVNTTEDPAEWDAADEILSLREAIACAETDDTIYFDSSLAGGTIVLNGTQLEIDKRITISASGIGGITIDAGGESRVFQISGGTENGSVELAALTITNGRSDFGGGIDNSGFLSLTNCVITGNTAADSGGGIVNFSGKLAAVGCIIAGNTATYIGGGIYNYGGLNLTNCSVSGNTVTDDGSFGGGIYNGDRLTLANCTVSGNSADSEGGGIYDEGYGFVLNNSVIAVNYAGEHGDYFGYIDIGDVSGNNIIGTDPGFKEAPVFESGVLINFDTLDLSLAAGSPAVNGGDNSVVTTKTDLAGNPRIVDGVVDLGAYEYQDGDHSTVVTTLDDVVDEFDGCISLREAITLYVTNGDTITFDSSLAGGTILLNGSQLEIDRGITIDASDIGGITVDAGGMSRVFFIDSGVKTELIALTITGGNDEEGGGVCNGGDLTLTNCTVSGNTAEYEGGGIYNGGNLTLTNCTVSGNTAEYSGGGIFNEWDNLTLTRCMISGNIARDSGGGIYNLDGNLTLTNCAVVDNTSAFGGGIYNIGDRYDEHTLALTNCTIACNTARFGGGIYDRTYPYDPWGPVISNSIIAMNSASGVQKDIYTVYGGFQAYNTLSSYTGWTDSTDCLTYDTSLLLFADVANGDYRLAAGSQAINMGNNSFVDSATDLAGNPRIIGETVDLGAYEFQRESPSTVVTALNDVVDEFDGFISLREAIEVYVAEGDTITFDSRLAGGTIVLDGAQLFIDRGIAIDASDIGGITIDGNGESGVMFIQTDSPDQSIELTGLTLTNGNNQITGYGGGAICNCSTGVLALINCSVTGSTAQQFGGGIANFAGGTITLTNCNISGNSTAHTYGGGGIFNWNGNLSLLNCTIAGNSAPQGGGINNSAYYDAVSNTITLTNCVISDNTATQSGGGILNSNSGTMILIDCSVTGNSVAGEIGGGGIINGGTMTVINSVISGNYAGSSVWQYGGGGILNYGSSSYGYGDKGLTLINCTVAGNSAEYGGGIYNMGDALTLINTIVAMNDGDDYCSGYNIGYYTGHNNIIGIDPGFKEAPVFRFGLLANSDTLDLSLTADSLAIDRGDNGAAATETDAAGNPRIVASWKTAPTVDIGAYEYQERTEVKSLAVTTAADLVDDTDNLTSLREAILYAKAGDVITFDTSLAGETITLADGELVIDKGITIDASDIGGITIDADGKSRVFHVSADISGLPVELVDLTITAGNSGKGGGIYNDIGNLALTNCTVSGNTADIGGGIYNGYDGILTLTNCTISENTANDDGGGIYNGDYSTLTLTNCTISENAANDDGGGIYNYHGSLTLTNCTISENTADEGGGIYDNGSLTLNNCAVSGNSAEYGGGIYKYDGSLTLNNCTVSGNSAEYGGGIYNYDGNLTLTNCTVSGNTADIGGGIYNDYGSLTLTNCTVSGNAANDSGGIYDYGYKSVLNNSIIAVNYAAEYGNDYSGYADIEDIGGCNIIGTDPGFKEAPVFESGVLVNFDTLDLSLTVGSPAIDRGDNSVVTTETDLAGNPRIVGGVVDLGAYEYHLSPIEVPSILTGSNGLYVSYGANRHQIVWSASGNTSGYELAYSADGTHWTTVSVTKTRAVITGLSYGADMNYRVRALGTDGYTSSDWSEVKTFNVCPMDINGDGDISGPDRALLSQYWLTEAGDDDYFPAADIDGDGDIAVTDYLFLSGNWAGEAGDDDLRYPAMRAAEAVFNEFASADLETAPDIF